MIYDDGEEWTGSLTEVYLLQGEREEELHPTSPQDQASLPVAIAQPIGPSGCSRALSAIVTVTPSPCEAAAVEGVPVGQDIMVASR